MGNVKDARAGRLMKLSTARSHEPPALRPFPGADAWRQADNGVVPSLVETIKILETRQYTTVT